MKVGGPRREKVRFLGWGLRLVDCVLTNGDVSLGSLVIEFSATIGTLYPVIVLEFLSEVIDSALAWSLGRFHDLLELFMLLSPLLIVSSDFL